MTKQTPEGATPGKKAEAPLPDPAKVVDDDDLTGSEKVQKLRRMRHDAHEIEVANEEGMGGTVKPSNLADVDEALRELGAPPSPPTPAPASQPSRTTTPPAAATGETD